MDAFTLKKIEFNAVRQILSRFCACALGKKAALAITPSSHLATVEQGLEQTSQMLEAVRDAGGPPFGGITDIHEAMGRAKPGAASRCEDFTQIADTLEGAWHCRAFLAALPEELDELHTLARSLGDFSNEIQAIRTIIGPQNEVRDDASKHLLTIRRELAETTRELHEVIHSYLRRPEVRKLLTTTSIMLHGDRYVLPVRSDHRGRLPGVVHRASNTGTTLFVEPNASVELNNKLVTLHDHERQEIDKLLTELAVKLLAREKAIFQTLGALTKLDLLSAKAHYANQFDMIRPTVREGGVFACSQARHPLLDFARWKNQREGGGDETSHSVVPIDIRLGSDFDILVITGSNTGGKTVAMKTAALLSTMAQSGLLIPARRGAKLPLFREILMDVGDEQSLEQSLSTFGGHIERLKAILRQADRHSLVLLDELGSGTDPDEGGAIGQAVLDALGRTGCLAMVSTHISILKAYAMNHERVDNGSVEFDTRTLCPTYHLRIGTPGESHAITVAEKLGLPGRITDDARKHLGQRGQQFRRAMRRTGKARQIAEEARADADAAKVHAETQAETYEDKLDDVRKLKDEFTTFLHHISALKPGDKIWVPAAKKHGHLARLELHKQVALVNVGSLQLEVPLADMMPDLGRHDVRHELNQLHTRAEEQANQAARDRDKAARLLAEAKTLEQQKRQQARQFDMWLNAIARVKVGDLAPIARKPGRGKVVEVNFPALRATIELEGGKIIQLPLQNLHPQTGPFAPGGAGTKKNASRSGKGNKKAAVRHRDPKSKSAKKDRRALLDTSPGEKVFVVPFQTAATLVRIDEDKNKATVLRGAFEIQVALSDLEPVGYQKEKRTP